MKPIKKVSWILVLSLLVSLFINVAPASAAVTWPSEQLLPSLSSPASTLDVISTETAKFYAGEGSQVSHATGHIDGDGWLCQTGIDAPNLYMIYGPYDSSIPVGVGTAGYKIKIDNNTADNLAQVRIDVYDATTATVLASQDITRQQFTTAGKYQEFFLTYNNTVAGHSLEFRVFWYGGAYIKVDWVMCSPKRMSEDSILFTTLKGLVNKTQPRIYSYDTNTVNGEGKYTWLEDLNLNYSQVTDKNSMITKYRNEISGIVVYDDNYPDTINLATTIAGLSNGIVAAPSQVAMLTSAPYNLSILSDLRGQFNNKVQIYQYLYNNYWSSCTHRILVGLNPEAHKGVIRDYALAIGAAVVWLDPNVPSENTLLRSFLSTMPENSAYMGWWTEEGAGVMLASEYSVSTVASDWSTNLSVFAGMSRAVSVKPVPAKPALQNKIYLTFIMSDGDNVQYMEHKMKEHWDNPDRGSVPIGWTVSPAALDVAPSLLDYYYDTATSNDCLISGPSGVGYTYPNYWPNQAGLDKFVRMTEDYNNRAGLRVITIWNTITGGINTNVGESFANNAPSLLGLTAMNGPGGQIDIYNNKLPSQRLNATYCYDQASLQMEVNNAIANWNGTSPRFVAIQCEPWDVTPTMIKNVASTLNSNVAVVRTDNYFQLIREYNGLPINPPATPLFSDNFNDGNANGWTTYGGTWAVQNNEYSVEVGDGVKSVANGTSFTDFTYEADVKVSSGTGNTNAGLMFRVTSPGIGADTFRGYYVGISANGDFIQLGKASNNWTELSRVTMPIDPDVSYHMKVIGSGTSIKVYVNDMITPKINITDATHTSGSIGVRAYNVHAHFDNILIY
jgi:hypothetical protein